MLRTDTHWTGTCNFQSLKGVCGPVLYPTYASTLQEVIPPPLDISGFVDDHSLKDSFKVSSREDELHTIRNLENSTKNVKVWMDLNHLNMNDGKTEFILFG